MDKRLQQDQEKVQKIQKEQQIEYRIPREELIHSSKFKESLIYNLTQKLLILKRLKDKYQEKLDQQETYPSFAKYYIHVPHLPVGLMFILMFMKYKKILGVNSFFIVMLNTVMLNEFGKYFRIKNINKELFTQYEDHSNNFKYLQQEFINQMPKNYLLKYGFGIDIDTLFNQQTLQEQKFYDKKYLLDLNIIK